MLPLHILGSEDYLAIQETLFRYNRSIDNGDVAEYRELFTEDAVKESPQVWGTLTGRESILRAHAEYLNSPNFASFRGGQHRIANLIVERAEIARTDGGRADAGRAETWCSFLFVIPGDSEPKIAATGEYRDVLIKRDGRWRIAHRIITITSNLAVKR